MHLSPLMSPHRIQFEKILMREKMDILEKMDVLEINSPVTNLPRKVLDSRWITRDCRLPCR